VTADRERSAAAWALHLREGGRTPWSRWQDTPLDAPLGTAEPSTGADGRRLPGAAQLELLRRVNQVGPLPHRVDHVLSRPGPGRGPAHLKLPAGKGAAAPRKEVLRVATGVLADLTAELPPPVAMRRRRPRRSSGPAYVLEGLPLTVAEVRAQLAAAGMPEHQAPSSWLRSRRDPGPEVVVFLVDRLDEALRQAWASRLQRGAARAWPRFVGEWAGRERLPASAALADNIGYWAERVGPGAVHLLVADPHVDAAERIAELLGRSLPEGHLQADPAVGDPVRLTPAALDVLRRVNVVLPFVSGRDERAAHRTALVQLLRQEDGRGEPADVPEEQRSWLAATASRLVDAVAGTGCTVHGDLERLAGLAPASGRRVGNAEVLDAMVRMIHRADTQIVAATGDRRGGR
jgi:hypothetical protein